MIARYAKQTFDRQTIRNGPTLYSHLEFSNCSFRNCIVALDNEDLSLRPRFSDCLLENCEQSNCELIAAVIENVTISGFRSKRIFQTWASVFRRVVLRGQIDGVMFSNLFHPGFPRSVFQRQVDSAIDNFYSATDWALDIRRAEFREFECRGIPTKLVLRNPETQFAISRQRLSQCSDVLDAGGTGLGAWLRAMLQDDLFDDVILVAPTRSPRFAERLQSFRMLRKYGIAEPD